MDKMTLQNLIFQKFGELVEVTYFDRKDKQLHINNLSWRDYLLQNYRFRLEWGKKKNSKKIILIDIEKFIEELENLPKDIILYSWSAKSINNKYCGWASEEKIIKITKST